MLQRYIDDFLSVNLADYDNIGIDFEISKFILLVFVGLCIAFFITDWHRGYMLLAVKKLFRHEALDENSAKTLSELGIEGSLSIKWALSHETRLSKIVKRVGAPEYTYEEYVALMKEQKKNPRAAKKERLDFEKERFYINPNQIKIAKDIEQNYSSSVVKTLLLCFMFAIIFVGVTLIMHDFLSFINSSIIK